MQLQLSVPHPKWSSPSCRWIAGEVLDWLDVPHLTRGVDLPERRTGHRVQSIRYLILGTGHEVAIDIEDGVLSGVDCRNVIAVRRFGATTIGGGSEAEAKP